MDSDSGNEEGEGGEIKGKEGKGTMSKRKRGTYQRWGLIEVTQPARSAALICIKPRSFVWPSLTTLMS